MHRSVAVLVAALVPAALLLAACGAPSSSAPTYTVAGRALDGPTCPVEPASPTPGVCEPRAVAGAVLVVSDPAGHEIERMTTGGDGSFTLELAAGNYRLTPQPVTGLLGTAPVIDFTITGTARPADLHVEYDTGIR